MFFSLCFFAVTIASIAQGIEQNEEILPLVNPEYLAQSHIRSQHTNAEIVGKDLSYVFLQRFPLQGTPFFHTEVLVCSKDQFSISDQSTLDDYVASLTKTEKGHQFLDKEKHVPFVEIDESWWTKRESTCTELGYGSAPCKRKCCGVPHGEDQRLYSFNARKSMITNADTSQKALFLYGMGDFSGNAAYDDICDSSHDKCWSNWSGFDYKLLKNNCNTFTSTVLSCVYGLSEEKPDLGVSDLVTVDCKCDPYDLEGFISVA